jgi:hypothetical protein
MDLHTLTTLAWRILALYFCAQALQALALALLLLSPVLGSPAPSASWPVLAAAACYGALAAMVFLAGPRLTARLSPGGREPGPGLDAGTLVAVGAAVVGLAVGLDGFLAVLRQLPLLRLARAWAAGAPAQAGELLDPKALLAGDAGSRLVWAVSRTLCGGLLFLLAKPLARGWGNINS